MFPILVDLELKLYGLDLNELRKLECAFSDLKHKNNKFKKAHEEIVKKIEQLVTAEKSMFS